jgi:hypothetical protein
MKIQYKEIDELLIEISISDCYLYKPKKDKSDKEKAFIYCKALELVRSNGTKGQYELDGKGVLVIDQGGIEKYLENIKIEKELNNNIKILTEKNLGNDFRNNIIYAVFGAILGLCISVLSLWALPNNTSEKIELLNTLVIEKNERDLDYQKRLNAINIELLSLRKGIDSLKYKRKNEKR